MFRVPLQSVPTAVPQHVQLANYHLGRPRSQPSQQQTVLRTAEVDQVIAAELAELVEYISKLTERLTDSSKTKYNRRGAGREY